MSDSQDIESGMSSSVGRSPKSNEVARVARTIAVQLARKCGETADGETPDRMRRLLQSLAMAERNQ